MGDKFVSIKIPMKIYQKIESMREGTNHKSLSDFIVTLLEEKIARYTAEKDGYTLTSDEEDAIKSRLRELGYLD